MTFAYSFSLVSSLQDKVIPSDLASFGEIGLSGEVRGAYRSQERIDEAKSASSTNTTEKQKKTGRLIYLSLRKLKKNS